MSKSPGVSAMMPSQPYVPVLPEASLGMGEDMAEETPTQVTEEPLEERFPTADQPFAARIRLRFSTAAEDATTRAPAVARPRACAVASGS